VLPVVGAHRRAVRESLVARGLEVVVHDLVDAADVIDEAGRSPEASPGSEPFSPLVLEPVR
jgi:hypothetical protein